MSFELLRCLGTIARNAQLSMMNFAHSKSSLVLTHVQTSDRNPKRKSSYLAFASFHWQINYISHYVISTRADQSTHLDTSSALPLSTKKLSLSKLVRICTRKTRERRFEAISTTKHYYYGNSCCNVHVDTHTHVYVFP